jgi:hypothetical protein
MSKVTELASGAITAVEHITIELIEADETPSAVIVRWPAKPTVLHPHRFRPPLILLPVCSPPLLLGWRNCGGSGAYEPVAAEALCLHARDLSALPRAGSVLSGIPRVAKLARSMP